MKDTWKDEEMTRATARKPRGPEDSAGETTNHTNDTNQEINFPLFIRVICVIRGCKMRGECIIRTKNLPTGR